MALIKICPACQAKNPASRLECDQCGTDLMGVRPRHEADPQTSSAFRASPATQASPASRPSSAAQEAPAAPQPLGAGRICTECGAVNPAASRRCRQCGEDISDVPPTPIAPRPAVQDGPQEAKPLSLTSLDGSFTLPLAADAEEIILGREGALQAPLASRMYVSRQQARLTPCEGGWQVENLSRTNPTFVNNEPLSPGEKRMLHAGDEIGLGGRVVEGERQEQAGYLLVREDA